MYKKSLVTLILICLSHLAYGQAKDSKIASSTNSVSTAIKNNEIDENKYARPDDFLYEEKVEDQVTPVDNSFQDEQAAQEAAEAAAQQKILDQQAAEEQARQTETASSEAL